MTKDSIPCINCILYAMCKSRLISRLSNYRTTTNLTIVMSYSATIKRSCSIIEDCTDKIDQETYEPPYEMSTKLDHEAFEPYIASNRVYINLVAEMLAEAFNIESQDKT